MPSRVMAAVLGACALLPSFTGINKVGPKAQELESEGLLATAENPSPRSITAEDLAKLTVLDALVHESLRLMPTAPNGGLRVLTSDTKARCLPCMTPKHAPLRPPPPPPSFAELHSINWRPYVKHDK